MTIILKIVLAGAAMLSRVQAEAPPPEAAGGHHGDVIFISDVDPFGGYYSGWQTLLVYGLALTATVIITRRNGLKAGRIVFYLGLLALVAVQIAPYLLLFPHMRTYGVTLAMQAPQALAQALHVAGFWLPAWWLTTAPGKFQQKAFIALVVSVINALITSVCLKMAGRSGTFDFDVLDVLMVATFLGVIQFTVHMVYQLASRLIARRLKPA